MTYACAKCQIEMRPKQNGVGAEAMSVNGPLSYTNADLIECPSCGVQILAGFARRPLIDRWDSNYDLFLAYQRASNLVYRVWFNQLERDRYQESHAA
jgi:DNA-directed RNA polymerase subunit RPC12/RpoP